jgi:hypothetical protein
MPDYSGGVMYMHFIGSLYRAEISEVIYDKLFRYNSIYLALKEKKLLGHDFARMLAPHVGFTSFHSEAQTWANSTTQG